MNLNTHSVDKMWTEFTRTNRANTALRDRIIEFYAPMAKKIACVMAAKTPAHVSADDFISEAYIGLMQAVEKFDPSKGWKFQTFASTRIRGAILDYTRTQDWASRAVRSEQSRLESTRSKLAQTLLRQPTNEEIANSMELTKDEFNELLAKIKQSYTVSTNQLVRNDSSDGQQNSVLDMITDDNADIDFDMIAGSEQQELLIGAMSKLKERERKIVAMYHYEEMTFNQIAKIYEVSDSRAAQIYRAALEKMAKSLKGTEFIVN